ncbi:MAG: hypothetical protein IPO83_03280 [Chitinophagaceae bacterium]|nr:hypothetical protein [Chitinophagaceae bacterium]
MAKEKVINLYIDAEWYLNQRIFLIGYSYDRKNFGQLYGKKLTAKNFKKLFTKVTGSVFCYGPDTGMLEKFFKWKFRDKFRCVKPDEGFQRPYQNRQLQTKGPGT